MTSRLAADAVLDGAAQMLARSLADAWAYLDLIYYAGTTDRVELMLAARDCCQLKGTRAIKQSLPVGAWPLRDEIQHGIGDVREGIQALDDLMHDTRIDLLMRGRAKAARAAMAVGIERTRLCLDQAAVPALAADAMCE